MDSYLATLHGLEDDAASSHLTEQKRDAELQAALEESAKRRRSKIRAAWDLLKGDEFLRNELKMPAELNGDAVIFVNDEDGYALHKLYLCQETESWMLDSGFCETDLGISDQLCLETLGGVLARIEFEHPIYMRWEKERLQT